MSATNTRIEQVLAKVQASVDATLEAARLEMLSILSGADESKPTVLTTYTMPTLADGHDPRNKNGANLTPRGIEILYRVFDDDGGYNRAAKMLGIAQGSAKNRKALWQREGGKDRVKTILDIDAAA